MKTIELTEHKHEWRELNISDTTWKQYFYCIFCLAHANLIWSSTVDEWIIKIRLAREDEDE